MLYLRMSVESFRDSAGPTIPAISVVCAPRSMTPSQLSARYSDVSSQSSTHDTTSSLHGSGSQKA